MLKVKEIASSMQWFLQNKPYEIRRECVDLPISNLGLKWVAWAVILVYTYKQMNEHTYIHTHIWYSIYIHAYIQADKHTGRQTDRKTDSQTERRTFWFRWRSWSIIFVKSADLGSLWLVKRLRKCWRWKKLLDQCNDFYRTNHRKSEENALIYPFQTWVWNG